MEDTQNESEPDPIVNIGFVRQGYTQVVRVVLQGLKSSSLGIVFYQDEVAWARHGIRVFRHRHFSTSGFDNGAMVLSHTNSLAQALRYEFEFPRTPICMEVKILYGTTNPMAMNMDITQVGPITVVVEQDTPSSCVSTDMSKATAERSLVAFFGERAFACMAEAHAGWEILEVSHPLSSAMQSYPYIVGVSASRARDMAGGYVQYHPGQRWMLLGGQQSFELLVRRVASSGVGNDVVVPLVSANVSGGAQAQPEDRMTVRFVVWKPRT
ncbi:Ff.00g044660.m01.CDS01 [Fusarium sp. VM40]|nr:Ff.00g044660.m01.CDS01 [Fusarium sp. VM40]